MSYSKTYLKLYMQLTFLQFWKLYYRPCSIKLTIKAIVGVLKIPTVQYSDLSFLFFSSWASVSLRGSRTRSAHSLTTLLIPGQVYTRIFGHYHFCCLLYGKFFFWTAVYSESRGQNNTFHLICIVYQFDVKKRWNWSFKWTVCQDWM